MISLEIHLQAMFQDDTVVVHVNGNEVFRQEGVTTDTKRMRASRIETHVPPGEVEIRVDVSTRSISGSQDFRIDQPSYVTVNLTDGHLEFREQPGGVFYI
jgi:hypothetical protein